MSVKNKNVNVLVLHQDFTVILGLTSYVMTHYPNQYFPLFLCCSLQNPINFDFLYLDILTLQLNYELEESSKGQKGAVYIVIIVQQFTSTLICTLI